MTRLEKHFKHFRKNIIGIDQRYYTPYGKKKIIYADWIASGRLYKPIERVMAERFGPFVANTHTEASETGTLMTNAYHHAHHLIKRHVNAGPNDVIITAGSGMTTVINKFQRMLGLRVCGELAHKACLKESERPVVFITHMEHHSNHTSWFETMADIVQLQPGPELLVDTGELQRQLEKYKDRKLKIGSFTACSNVTGIETPIHELARIMHNYGGVCVADYAASAPYVDINMHPADPMEKLDAVMFSPHKFLGGPGSSGVLIFDSSFYTSKVPDNPGGGTVDWTNAWGEYKYIDDIEAREDGGTPGFLQAIRTALCLDLKNQMGTSHMREREDEMLEILFDGIRSIPDAHILANNVEDRLGVVSFYFDHIHYNLVVKLLSDRYGIQARGGCACAGTYGHFLLNVDYEKSKKITEKINTGDLSEKPGWVRISVHPTMTNKEVLALVDALKNIHKYHKNWQEDYIYQPKRNEFAHREAPADNVDRIREWFNLPNPRKKMPGWLGIK
ncbi:MAG: aminotransferase class V-fold PLP-dependent enzyme [Bacteroidia bacterium]|nr:MAG: aminotransferase class V-fold PLP-dependent enzyme [Bacteroidia bacterium]